MKTLTFYLTSGQTVKIIAKKESVEEFLTFWERGLKKKKGVLVGEDYQGNPFYVRVESVAFLEVGEMDIRDL